ncbi:multifunctional protein ADE2-like isoform X2 [Hyperolius riggenbachi]|uniref:multifunctional protein ADE2-like isoform X2 n=1 Tax=Hyperolius riggenbachi TaxID=752182 RepID=UPI0035A3155E
MERAAPWTEPEVRALISLWSEESIRRQLQGTLRNKGLFMYIALRMRQLGIFRDWKQCRSKYKNLKYEYRAVRSSARAPVYKIPFYDELHALLGAENEEEEPRPLHAAVTAAEPAETESPGEGTNDLLLVPDVHIEGGKHWSPRETLALINIWSDNRIKGQLKDTVRNQKIFEHIASLLQQAGIDRDWRQCRTKYKNLKHEYAVVKKAHESGNRWKTMRYFKELDVILSGKPSVHRRTNPERPSPIPSSSSVPATVGCFSGPVSDPVNENLMNNGAPILKEDLDTTVQSPERDNQDSPAAGNITTIHVKEETSSVATERMVASNGEALPAHLKRRTPPDDIHSTDQRKHARIHTPTRYPPCQAATVKCEDNSEEEVISPSWRHENACEPQSSGSTLDHSQVVGLMIKMESGSELRLGRKISEGKTKEVYELPDHPGCVLMQSKDQITAGNAARKDHMEGKASISNKTTSCVFKLLQEAGIKTAFVKKCSDTGFIATHCEMIPIEWVCRRIATGSFLKRNPGVKEGYTFYPPKVEMFFKDDANNDPQWSEEQLIAAKMTCSGVVIGQAEVDIMKHSTVAIFEILEKSWTTQDCTLVDMKIEFGVDVTKKEIVLADVIDNDSWRLWPSGDKTQQKDKQTYRDLKEVTPEAMQMVKRNFEWVAERVQHLLTSGSQERVVVLMGSISDLVHCEKIKKSCANYGIPCELRVTSAHKGPDETLRIKSEYEGDGIPTVFVAVAGRSNGLGPVLSGNTPYPVINCPPLTPDWGAQDVWSSLRMPSGLGCSTVLSPEAAAQFAAQIFGLNNHLIWSKLRSCTLNTWISLKQADVKLRECSM